MKKPEPKILMLQSLFKLGRFLTLIGNWLTVATGTGTGTYSLSVGRYGSVPTYPMYRFHAIWDNIPFGSLKLR